MRSFFYTPYLLLVCFSLAPALCAADTAVDLANYDPQCGINIQQEADVLNVVWPIDDSVEGRMRLNVDGRSPLFENIGIARRAATESVSILERAEPVVWVTEGTRQPPSGKPEDQFWQVFFDNPHQRPHTTDRSRLDLRTVHVRSSGQRATVRIERLTVGTFQGALEITLYRGTPLVQVEAVLATDRQDCAFYYDAGMILRDEPQSLKAGWFDTEGQLQRRSDQLTGSSDTHLAVRYRAIALENGTGSIACFPPPHQFQFPRDYSDNLRFVWYGRDHSGRHDGFGFGIRQNKDGGGPFVPWFNAPPETEQRMSVFYLLADGDCEQALDRVLSFTHRDRFPELPGYLTLTSHWHMAIAVAALAREGNERTNPPTPDFVRMFRDMNVNIVHLAEFHGDGHQFDGGETRLHELQAMFEECRRWSDDRLLFIPGEEVNTYLGVQQEGKHPGHWMSLFPKPVYWILQRENQPFVEEHAKYGRIYRVGSRGDMVRLLREEAGLVWSAHPRIKASSWTPDIFREEDFFIADYWLGGAWKAMPGDLSRPRLGERVLDLLDDMANWGHKKYVLGEVDVFKIDHTHELYAHMNVNYVRLDRLPKFDEGWQEITDALRDGQFFVTTGEVLISDFTVGGVRSGGNLSLSDDATPQLRAEITWTFPLAFAEVVSGDGNDVYRERIELTHTGAFGRQTLEFRPALTGRRWLRLELWDVAANGAFTQPIWIDPIVR